jgi:hypothetical protein
MRDEREPSNSDDASEREVEDRRADALERAVEEALEESFPASDPPSWEPLRSGPPKNSEPEADTR